MPNRLYIAAILATRKSFDGVHRQLSGAYAEAATVTEAKRMAIEAAKEHWGADWELDISLSLVPDSVVRSIATGLIWEDK